MENVVISIKDFSKSFGDNHVIDDLSFEVYEGEIFAFLGANGSGKTTTIRCLLDIYSNYSGKLEVFGKKFSLDAGKDIGYLPEERGLYLGMNVLETLVYFAEIKGMDEDSAYDSAKEYLNLVGLSERSQSEVKSLSSGQQQKIQLGLALIHKPKLLILDEPTKGLDPVNRIMLVNLLKELSDDGTTIIFSTHIMEEAEKIADRVGILKDGKFAVYGPQKEIKELYSDKTIIVRSDGDLPKNDKMYSFVKKKDKYIVKPKNSFKANNILQHLVNEGTEINEFTVSLPSLEDIFVTIMNDEHK